MSSTYHTRQDRKSSQRQDQECQGNSHWWVLGILLENVVDFGQLAVSRRLDRRNGLIGAVGNRELKSVFIVCWRAAEGSDEESRVDRFRERQELNGEVLLSLPRKAR